MPKPLVAPTKFASSSTFLVGSGVPAGLIGSSVRISGPASFYQFGIVPGQTLKSQWLNQVIGLSTDYDIWLYEGTSSMTKTAHPVETDASGISRLWGLRIGDGTATGLNATKKLQIVGDGTQQAMSIDVPATGLEGLSIESDSNMAVGFQVLMAGTRGAVYLDASGASDPTLEVVATSQPAVLASATSGVAIEATNTSGAAAVRGTGNVAGLSGVAGAAGGAGGVFQSHSSANSSGRALIAQASASAIGLRASSVDGSAIQASSTGDVDAIHVQASGTGAALRLDPQAAVPVTARAGQLYMVVVDTNICSPMLCAVATGLGTPEQYLFFGNAPSICDYNEDNATQAVAQNTTNTVVLTLTVDNPYASPVRVVVRGAATFVPNPIGAIPLAACTVTLHDVTAGSTIETDSFTFSSGTARQRFPIEGRYDLPATTTTTLQLRVSVAAGAGGSIDVSHRKLAVQIHSAGFE